MLTPFAVAVLAGIVYLLIRRAFIRPAGLGDKVSIESIVIGLFIATLMVTFLLGVASGRIVARRAASTGGSTCSSSWRFSRYPGLEALPPGAVADHRVPEVARARERAEPRFREGASRAGGRQGPRQQDGARRVHLRRVRTLPGELSGVGRGQGAQSEDAHPADPARASGGPARDEARRDLFGEGSVAVHDVRRLREPVSRSASSTCRSSSARAAVWCRTATRRTIWAACTTTSSGAEHLGTELRSAAEVRRLGGARDVRSGEARRPRLARMRRRVRGRFSEVAALAVRDSQRAPACASACSSKERCTGDPAKRTGNEYMFQELAKREYRGPQGRRSEEDSHFVSALREDNRRRLPAVRATRSRSCTRRCSSRS